MVYLQVFCFPNCFPADHSICCQHSSSPLCNGAIAETSDGKIVLLRRSNNVDEFPGGHLEIPIPLTEGFRGRCLKELPEKLLNI
ncbi:Nudix hydrolase 9 [Cucurbita argyrosperma subsp. argyrosperma]|nr:Nudix hydrolase 9 [Cucurbita argyrosperma subsp. argyrosperma]